MKPSYRVFLLLGSNQNAAANLNAALGRLRQRAIVLDVSPVYESPPVGDVHGAPYLNAAVLLETPLDAPAFKSVILAGIEAALGRERGSGAGVTIDLDIMLWDAAAFTYGGKPWRVPHPDITEHAHAAQPLADIAPGYVLPGDGRTLAEIAASLPGEGLRRRDDVTLYR